MYLYKNHYYYLLPITFVAMTKENKIYNNIAIYNNKFK